MGLAVNYNRTGVETIQFGKYNISNSDSYIINICFMQNITSGDSVWRIENPLANYVPGLAMQVAFTIFLSRLFMYILKPLRQQRFIAEVIAGIFIGPTYFRKLKISSVMYTFEANLVLETFASFGLTYYMFLVGLEMDLTVVKHLGKKTRSLVMAAILIPMVVGAGLYFVPMRTNKARTSIPLGAIFWAITVSSTSFPDLARILSDVKLLHTDIGRMALTTSIISDITTWVLLVASITIFDEHKFLAAALPTIVFLLVCWFLLRPAIACMIRKTKKEGGKFSDVHINFILTGVAACGFITDACGSHSMIGGFMLGLIIPHGELAIIIMERIGDFVNGIMLPSFMMVNGLRTNFSEIPVFAHWAPVIFIVIGATCAKIISTLLVSLYIGLSLRDGLSLGGLMNTKGVLALIVLNEGRSLRLIDNVTFTVMVLALLFMSALVGPIFSLANRAAKRTKKYKQRTIQRSNPNTQLRVLACIHSIRNLSGIINLLEVSNATRRSPISVFVVHLVELIGRASALLIVQETGRTSAGTNPPSREKAESDQIIGAFESFEARNESVSMQPLTVVSPYTTMHEDIVRLAEDKLVAMILIPFHKQMTSAGVLQGENHSIKEVNNNLLLNSPCSVGMLVDRGLGSLMSSNPTSNYRSELRFAMFFVGGLDDHEALSYAHRMSGTPGISLTVVRFLPGKEADQLNVIREDENNQDRILDTYAESEKIKEHDDEYINEFRFKSMNDQSVTYHEKLVNNGVELLESIRTKYVDQDLYIVGRGQGVNSPLTMGLSEWSEDPELGAIGEALVSSEFTAHASVLVVQQPSGDGYMRTSSTRHGGKFGQKKWASPILNPDYEIIQNRKKNDYTD